MLFDVLEFETYDDGRSFETSLVEIGKKKNDATKTAEHRPPR